MLPQHCEKMLVILISLKAGESLENGLQPHSGVTPMFSMRTELQASSHSCHNVDADAWCKWALTSAFALSINTTIFCHRTHSWRLTQTRMQPLSCVTPTKSGHKSKKKFLSCLSFILWSFSLLLRLSFFVNRRLKDYLQRKRNHYVWIDHKTEWIMKMPRNISTQKYDKQLFSLRWYEAEEIRSDRSWRIPLDSHYREKKTRI